MRDDLLFYYERELAFMRRMGAEFSAKYPRVASRLQLEPTKCEDPHVERLLEGFAFLAARIHLKMDDDLPEISESLLNIIYPHYVRPTPSMSIVEMQVAQEQGQLPSGFQVPRGARLFSRPVGGTACTFRTCYDTTLWPVSVREAQWQATDRLRPAVSARDAVAALRLELRGNADAEFKQLELDTLRFHLAGESSLTYTLYELLCSRCVRILIREPDGKGGRQLTLPPSALQPVGFGPQQGMLPFPRRSFVGYGLLQEYFSFPDKFLFLDLSGFDEVRAAGFGNAAEVIFLIAPFDRPDRRATLEAGVNSSVFRLGCTPVVNLFQQMSEPILLTQKEHEYLLVADARRRETVEIFSVDEVLAISPDTTEPLHFEPLYSHRHSVDSASPQQFWSSVRRPSGWRRGGATDVYLSFVDLSSRVVYPSQDTAMARLTCYNGDLPNLLPFGQGQSDFELQDAGPIQRIAALVKPTPVLHPPLGKPLLWRLISQLSLNYLSLVDGGEDALQEILRLHNFAEHAAGERQIQGIKQVRSSPMYARVASEDGISFARGRRVEMVFDEEHFAGGGVFLFASVLERFFGMYANINSYTALTARTEQRKNVLHEWAPRAGWKPLM